MRNLGDVIKETSLDNPYDATRAGPMCEQGNRSPDSVQDLNEKNINDIIEEILSVIYHKLYLSVTHYLEKTNLLKLQIPECDDSRCNTREPRERRSNSHDR